MVIFIFIIFVCVCAISRGATFFRKITVFKNLENLIYDKFLKFEFRNYEYILIIGRIINPNNDVYLFEMRNLNRN